MGLVTVMQDKDRKALQPAKPKRSIISAGPQNIGCRISVALG